MNRKMMKEEKVGRKEKDKDKDSESQGKKRSKNESKSDKKEEENSDESEEDEDIDKILKNENKGKEKTETRKSKTDTKRPIERKNVSEEATTSEKEDKNKSKNENKNDDFSIQSLQAKILELEALLKLKIANTETSDTTTTALAIHQEVAKTEKAAYDRLKEVVKTAGPKMVLQTFKIEKATPFSSPLKIVCLKEIPSLFSLEVIGKGSALSYSSPLSNVPAYLEESGRAFAFGVTEVRFVMKSVGFIHPIDFRPGGTSKILKDVVGNLSGPTHLETSKLDFVMSVFEVMFLIYLNCQFILSEVPLTTMVETQIFPGDMISTFSMMKNQYVDQGVALLPAAGWNNATGYLREMLEDMFSPVSHAMQLGELGREILSQKKIFRRVGVITDQFTAAINEIFHNYLNAQSVNYHMYLEQHNVLTMENVSIKLKDPSVFKNSLVPMWRREESDGCLLLYALNIERQRKYLCHLTELLASVNLVSFATIDEVANSGPRKNLRDATIQRVLDNVLSTSNQFDFFRALALDLSTTWVDCELEVTNLGNSPLDSFFKIFTILLWYCYFPSIARDNAPKLMYELFIALEQLDPTRTAVYMQEVGYAIFRNKKSVVKEYSKEEYLQGMVTFPLITSDPASRYPVFRTIHALITQNDGMVMETRDSPQVQTPRMSDVRKVYQPYDRLTAVSNTVIDGEHRNSFSEKLIKIIALLIKILVAYKERYRDTAARSSFGTDNASASQLLGFISGYTGSLLASIGIRSHAEMYVLRQLGADSPYVVDCQNFFGEGYKTRPQVAFELENGTWASIMMQRLSEEIPFELPLFLFLTLRGATSLEAIMPPDASVQFTNLQNMQQEGILCGDVIKYVNNLKFGNVGVFNREALGVNNFVTASRADRIFTKLSEMSALSEFKELFKILIDDVSQRIDSRAIGFKISMQTYHSVVFNRKIPQPRQSQYDLPLKLGRHLLDDVMTTVSPLFVPETSPIALYTNGVFLIHRHQNDLDPYAVIGPDQIGKWAERIVMWSPRLIDRVVKDNQRFIDESVLKIPKDNSGSNEYEEYRLNERVPKILIIVTANTGPIGLVEFEFLAGFFRIGRLAFLYPELMGVVDRVVTEQTVTEEINLESQFKEVVTGLPNRRVNLAFGDTISKPYRLACVGTKLKYIYPIFPMNQRDVVLRGMTDSVQKPPEFKIGTWMSWAFGQSNAKLLSLEPSERLSHLNREAIIPHETRLISKLELGLVNMNNEMKILVGPEYLKTPSVIQDVKNAYVGIYTTP